METMVLMAGYDLPLRAIRSQVASAVDIIIHIDRFGDGSRRVTHISEVQGMEGDIITLQDIYRFNFAEGGTQSARSTGRLRPTGLRPKVVEKLQEAGVNVPPKLFRPTENEAAAAPGSLRAVTGTVRRG
jgi:pilus assembly protein CpaF